VWFVCLAYGFFGGLFGLRSCGGKATVEEDVELVEGGIPAVSSRRRGPGR